MLMMTTIATIVITMTTEIVRLRRSSFEENLFSRMHFRGEWGKARRNEDKAKVRPPLSSLAPSPFPSLPFRTYFTYSLKTVLYSTY